MDTIELLANIDLADTILRECSFHSAADLLRKSRAAVAQLAQDAAKDKARCDFKDAGRREWAAGYGLRCQSWRDDIDKEMADALLKEKTS